MSETGTQSEGGDTGPHIIGPCIVGRVGPLADPWLLVLDEIMELARGMTCRICGCDDLEDCTDLMGDPCSWVEIDLCSVCASRWNELLGATNEARQLTGYTLCVDDASFVGGCDLTEVIDTAEGYWGGNYRVGGCERAQCVTVWADYNDGSTECVWQDGGRT